MNVLLYLERHRLAVTMKRFHSKRFLHAGGPGTLLGLLAQSCKLCGDGGALGLDAGLELAPGVKLV